MATTDGPTRRLNNSFRMAVVGLGWFYGQLIRVIGGAFWLGKAA